MATVFGARQRWCKLLTLRGCKSSLSRTTTSTSQPVCADALQNDTNTMHESVGYPAAKIPNLPSQLGIKGISSSLKLNYLLKSDVPKLYHLVSSSARASLNVGIDEYPDLPSIQRLVRDAECFAVRGHQTTTTTTTDDLAGAIVIHPNRLTPSMDPRLANLVVFVHPELYDKDNTLYSQFVSMAVDLTRQLKLKYSGCTTQVLATNVSIAEASCQQHFYTIATIPEAARVDGYEDMVSNMIMYKNFNVHAQEMRSATEMEEYSKRIFPKDTEWKPSPDEDYYPISFLLPNGLRVQVDNMSEQDIDILYSHLREVAGQGYGIDQFINYEVFRATYVHGRHCYKITHGEDLVAYFTNGRDTAMGRSVECCSTSGTGIISAAYRSKGDFKHIYQVTQIITKMFGFRSLKSSFVSTNLSLHRAQSPSVVSLGLLPHCLWTRGGKLMGRVITYDTYECVPALSDLEKTSDGVYICPPLLDSDL